MIEHRDRSRPLTARERHCIFPHVIAAIDFSAASLGAARWGIANVAARADAIVCHVVPSAIDASSERTASTLWRWHAGTARRRPYLEGWAASAQHSTPRRCAASSGRVGRRTG